MINLDVEVFFIELIIITMVIHLIIGAIILFIAKYITKKK